jgi:hypothetical protein
MSTLQFRSPASVKFDFDDWLQAPAMIAHLINPSGGSNAEAALRSHLRLSHGFDLASVDRGKGRRTTLVRGTLWKPVGESAGSQLATVHVPFAVEGEVTRGPAGEIRDVRFNEPEATDLTAAASMVRSLARHGQIRESSQQPTDSTTHDIETDDQGRRRLIRKRFQAI